MIELVGISVERGGRRVIDAIDLRIPPARWFGVIGANGSGKTSLLRALGGRLAFAGGDCRIEGEACAHDRHARATRFGFAPPPERLPEAMRVRDILALVGGDVDGARERGGAIFAALGVEPLLDRWIGDCSAGMRQRVAIALAFAEGRRAVILDEPFNWLDPVAAYDLRMALRGAVAGGLTLITALHDLGTLASACDEGVMLADGRVAMRLDGAQMAEAARDPQGFERRTIDLLRG